MKNKLRKRIEFIGLEYKKEVIKIIIFVAIPVVFAVGLYLLFKEMIFIFLSLGMILGVLYFYLNSYKNKEEKILVSRDNEFINIINYFQTFISNGNNVYQSFRKLIEYSSFWMKDQIQSFLSDIDIDKSVKPYSDFANKFRINFAKNIMYSIYQMVDMGEDDKHIQEFELLFHELSIKSLEKEKETRNKTLGILASTPMIGAAYITILLSISIISIMGELINVI